jgi:hypothetical protein
MGVEARELAARGEAFIERGSIVDQQGLYRIHCGA